MAFVFKVKLDGITKPPVWRKIKINNDSSFYDLHIAIQGAMGWGNYHLYQFSPRGWATYPALTDKYDEDWSEPLENSKNWPYGEKFESSKIKLSQYFTGVKQKIVYIYDFGDDWRHIVELIEITDDEILQPFCISGKGACPPEDCGSIWGYYDMVEAVNNPAHPEHAETLEWLGLEKGDKWDMHEFDLEEANERMGEYREEFKKS